MGTDKALLEDVVRVRDVNKTSKWTCGGGKCLRISTPKSTVSKVGTALVE